MRISFKVLIVLMVPYEANALTVTRRYLRKIFGSIVSAERKKLKKFTSRKSHANLYTGIRYKRINYFKLGVNEHVIITNFHDFSQTFRI